MCFRMQIQRTPTRGRSLDSATPLAEDYFENNIDSSDEEEGSTDFPPSESVFHRGYALGAVNSPNTTDSGNPYGAMPLRIGVCSTSCG